MIAHLAMTGITKRFGAVTALDAVNLEVEKGTIHAIVGENGAGKTTLMKVLYGAHQADAGAYSIDGNALHFRNSADAIAAKIGMVSQHYSIIPDLTCLQNLILGSEPGVFIDEAAAQTRAQVLAESMRFTFDWKAEASTLSPAAAQKLEILKLLWREADILILDEPTAMLSPADGDALFESLTNLASQGKTILLVTHRLPEVLQFCKRVHVLRGGKNVAQAEVVDTNSKQLAEWIVGHALADQKPSAFTPGVAMLDVRSLRVKGDRGEEAVKGIDLALRAGEVVGLAGVDGNGQRELFQALVGVVSPIAGSISLAGQSLDRLNPADRISAGIRLIPEDRHEEGVVEDWSLDANAALGLQRMPALCKGALVDVAARKSLAARIAERFRTKHGGLDQPMRSLSGGNQQRFVAARALELGPKLLLAFQPTRGLDIDGTRSVYDAIRETCRAGAAALVVSFDLDELLENCDRVIAINHGQIFSPPEGQERDRQAIGRLMVGAQEPAA